VRLYPETEILREGLAQRGPGSERVWLREGLAQRGSGSLANGVSLGHGRPVFRDASREAIHLQKAALHMTFIDLEAFGRTTLQRDPYEHLIVSGFVRPDGLPQISADFPRVPGPGSHPPSELSIVGGFKALIDELLGADFQRAVEQKFDVDLSGRPTMYTVRGFVAERDGDIHTDSKTKIITALIYLNEGWEADGGRLRILRRRDDLEDFAAEVPPFGGTLLVFRRSDRSWHGHKRHSGPRRAVQLNWVTEQSVVDREQNRHRLSTRLKKMARALLGR